MSSYTAGDPRLDNFQEKYDQIMSGQNTLNLSNVCEFCVSFIILKKVVVLLVERGVWNMFE